MHGFFFFKGEGKKGLVVFFFVLCIIYHFNCEFSSKKCRHLINSIYLEFILVEFYFE